MRPAVSSTPRSIWDQTASARLWKAKPRQGAAIPPVARRRLLRRHRGQPDRLGRMARVRARGRGQRDVAPAPIYRPAAPRKALFMRVCQPGPLALNRSTTS